MKGNSEVENRSGNAETGQVSGRTGPVMLALSTFRQSKQAVRLALEKARVARKLIVVYVADVNLARYFIGTDVGLCPELEEKCREELLREHEQKGQEKVESIVGQAEAEGLEVVTYVRIGRFGLVCLEVVKQEQPSLIVTTRSRRPKWVKRFFGSPVDYLIAHAGCPVIEA